MEASVVLTKDLDFSEQEGRSPESIHAAATDKLLSVTRVFFPGVNCSRGHTQADTMVKTVEIWKTLPLM